MRQTFAILAALVLLGCTGQALEVTPVPEYRGRRHPPLPDSAESLAGYLLGADVLGGHAVEHLRIGIREYLLLSRGLGRDSSGKAAWEILDAVALPPRPADLEIALGTCGRGVGPAWNADSEVIAYVRPELAKEFWAGVAVAWRASRATGRFEPEPVRGLRCINEGYGL
jgi:hypothetical protein